MNRGTPLPGAGGQHTAAPSGLLGTTPNPNFFQVFFSPSPQKKS